MSHFHAAMWIDHQEAQFLQLNANSIELQKAHAHKHDTPQRDSKVSSEHELLGEVWGDLADFVEVVITNSHTARADFRHYVTEHSSAISSRIVGWEIIDHPTDGQLMALAKNIM